MCCCCCCSDCVLVLVAILFPPLPVWIRRGLCSADGKSKSNPCYFYRFVAFSSWFIVSLVDISS